MQRGEIVCLHQITRLHPTYWVHRSILDAMVQNELAHLQETLDRIDERLARMEKLMLGVSEVIITGAEVDRVFRNLDKRGST